MWHMPDTKIRTMLMGCTLSARCRWHMPDKESIQAEMIP